YQQNNNLFYLFKINLFLDAILVLQQQLIKSTYMIAIYTFKYKIYLAQSGRSIIILLIPINDIKHLIVIDKKIRINLRAKIIHMKIINHGAYHLTFRYIMKKHHYVDHLHFH
ncbi:hypothetical protein ACJX0J_006822, partial [Zea mays]